MVVKTKLLFRNYLRLIFITTFRNPWLIFLSCIGLIMLVSSIFYFIGFEMPFENPPYWQIILGFFIVVVIPFSIFYYAKRNYLSNKWLHENITYDISDDKLKIIGESFTSEFNWDNTLKILELKNWILVYQDRLVVNLIPKDCFGNDLIHFKEIIKRKSHIKTNFSWTRKLYNSIIITLPLLFFLLIGLVFALSKAEPEIYLIPENYNGVILVFCDQPNGVTQQLDGRKRVYQIPENGILFTQNKWNSGSHNRKFFYVKNNEKIEINEVNSNYYYKNENDSDIVSVIDKKPYYFKDADNNKYLFRAFRFIVSKRKDFDKYDVELKTDSIIENVFNER